MLFYLFSESLCFFRVRTLFLWKPYPLLCISLSREGCLQPKFSSSDMSEPLVAGLWVPGMKAHKVPAMERKSIVYPYFYIYKNNMYSLWGKHLQINVMQLYILISNFINELHTFNASPLQGIIINLQPLLLPLLSLSTQFYLSPTYFISYLNVVFLPSIM